MNHRTALREAIRMDRTGAPSGVMTIDRPRPALLPPSRLRPLAGLAEEIQRQEREDNQRGYEEEPEGALLVGFGGRCELCGFLRCTCVSGLLAGLALLLAASAPEASGACPNCQGNGGWSKSGDEGGVHREWWESCGPCSGTGRR